MGGITLEDFSQSMAYRKIFGLRELDITLRQLRRRCGALTAEQVAHIRSLARPRLEALAEALLYFQGSDETLGGQLAEWVPSLCLPCCSPSISA
jgi:hypothetical protein